MPPYGTNVGIKQAFPIRDTVSVVAGFHPQRCRAGQAGQPAVAQLRHPPPAQLVPRMGYGHRRPGREASHAEQQCRLQEPKAGRAEQTQRVPPYATSVVLRQAFPIRDIVPVVAVAPARPAFGFPATTPSPRARRRSSQPGYSPVRPGYPGIGGIPRRRGHTAGKPGHTEKLTRAWSPATLATAILRSTNSAISRFSTSTFRPVPAGAGPFE